MPQTYKQCNLSKPSDGGIAKMTSWIRNELAVVGSVLDRLEDPETGQFESGWTVDDVTEPAVDERLLLGRAHRTSVFGSLVGNRIAKE